MKLLFLVQLVFMAGVSYSQILSDRNKVEFNIVCFKENISDSSSPEFILKIRNLTNAAILMPDEFLRLPNREPMTEIGYDIEFCPGDSSHCSLISNFHLGALQPKREYTKLRQYQTRLVEITTVSSLYETAGLYKIRFYFHLEKFVKGERTITTPWVYVRKS